MNSTRPHPELYPCHFPIKAFGFASEGFASLVFDLVKNYVDNIDEKALTCTTSKNGKYHAVTIVIEAQSKAQLDAIYQALHAHEKIVMVL